MYKVHDTRINNHTSANVSGSELHKEVFFNVVE